MQFFTIFTVFIVLNNFKSSFEMAIAKNAASSPETTQDCSDTETITGPEVAPDSKAELPEDDSASTPITKRCSRRETLTIDERVGAPLSLTRRDVNLERKIQRCESCKNGSLCAKHKVCSHCRIYCSKLNNTEVTTDSNDIDNGASTVVPEAKFISERSENDTTEAVVSSRFGGEEEEGPKPKYYTLGTVEPGPLMHLFSKAFNIPSGQNFDKLIILGKVKGQKEVEDFDNILILDVAKAFGDDPKAFATVHQMNQNINPAKIQELDRRLDEAFARKKQELNTDQLDSNQIHEVINEALEAMAQKSNEESPTVAETETKCSVDETVDDLLDIMPTGERSQPKPDVQNGEERIINPPVIQDGLNTVGKNIDDGWIDDNEEARPSMENDKKLSKFKQNPKKISPNEINPTENIIGAPEEEQEIITVPSDVKLAPESDNQVTEPSKTIQSRVNPSEEMEKIIVNTEEPEGKLLEKSIPRSESLPNLEQNIIKTVEESVPTPESSPGRDLEQNIIKTIEDSLKIASINDGGDNLGKSEPEKEPIKDPVEGQAQQVFFADDEPRKPSQAIAENVINEPIEIPQNEANNQVFENSQQGNLVNTEDISDSVESLESEEMSNTNTNSPTVAEVPEFENRGQFSDEYGSPEKLSNFGALVPVAKEMEVNDNRPGKKLYFIGKDIKLPLKMVQDENGVMQLRVDVEKLCHCKNINCTKKHVDSEEVKEAMTTDLNKDIDNKENLEDSTPSLPELQVRLRRTHEKDEELMNSFVDNLDGYVKNSEIFKRSPEIDPEILKIDKVYKFENPRNVRLEKELEKLSNDIEKFNEENFVSLNKGNVALFKDVEKTKDVGRMITLANNVLMWMKDLATKNLES